jgi:hypothetical protein
LTASVREGNPVLAGGQRSVRITSRFTPRLTFGTVSGITHSIGLYLTRTSMDEFKVRENRLRRSADRQGYRLMKSRSRDPRALDHGLYALIMPQTGGAVNRALADHWTCSWTLDQVEAYLAR